MYLLSFLWNVMRYVVSVYGHLDHIWICRSENDELSLTVR